MGATVDLRDEIAVNMPDNTVSKGFLDFVPTNQEDPRNQPFL
jgi:hypothetical protein